MSTNPQRCPRRTRRPPSQARGPDSLTTPAEFGSGAPRLCPSRDRDLGEFSRFNPTYGRPRRKLGPHRPRVRPPQAPPGVAALRAMVPKRFGRRVDLASESGGGTTRPSGSSGGGCVSPQTPSPRHPPPAVRKGVKHRRRCDGGPRSGPSPGGGNRQGWAGLPRAPKFCAGSPST